MSSKTQAQAQAQQRARVILQVRSGRITATEGARQLGISRKTYYQWEKRALQGMLAQLEEQPPGRPSKDQDPQLEKMQRRIAELESRLKVAEQTAEVRAVLMAMREKEEKEKRRSAKKRNPHRKNPHRD